MTTFLNNDYSDTADFRRGWVGEVGVVTVFVLKVPDYESAMLIYLYRRCHEKTSYVLNYAFFTLLHKWVFRGQTCHFEKLQ